MFKVTHQVPVGLKIQPSSPYLYQKDILVLRQVELWFCLNHMLSLMVDIYL